ncbi:MAG: hypothetical protein U9R08_04610 [Nanoarchaeota archaeon]|nr:hypothetical protein [Nanoarchaeota archaeon]
MVNVNIKISNELHKKIKVKCAINSITLKDFVIKSLKKKLKNG